MKILFVHQNFPGQFKHLAPTLAADGKNEVVAFTMNAYKDPANLIKTYHYNAQRGTSHTTHPWVTDFEAKIIRGDAALDAALKLKKTGFYPDVIYAHPGWGESLFLKDVWPNSKLVIYCEFYYHHEGADVGFDPEFSTNDPKFPSRLSLKNLNYLIHMQFADLGIAPTNWQKSTYPSFFQEKIKVIHDGIDTEKLCPNRETTIVLNGQTFNQQSELITFVNRNLEPYRGYHSFMRAIPKIQKQNPRAHILIIGGNDTSYGASPAGNKTWKQIFIDEMSQKIDFSKIHFVGNLPYEQYLGVMKASSCHVYLTYPFVLSWSLLESMSCAGLIVASNTKPLLEVIKDKENGYLTNFFDYDDIAEKVTHCLKNQKNLENIRQNSRQTIIKNYDLRTICLPQQISAIKEII